MSRAYVFTQYGGPEFEQLIDRPIPEPGPGEILIEVRAAGVNPVDWKIREGNLGRSATLPAPMGREAAGVITAIGPDVESFAVGDEVAGSVAAGYGGFADHAVLRASSTIVKPEDISFAVATSIPVAGTTAYDVTHQIDLDVGESIVILGAGGGVGHLAAQIGQVHEFRVIGVASESKRDMIESIGATFVASGPNAADDVAAILPGGADLVIDLVGGQALRDIAAVAKTPDRIVSVADSPTVTDLGGAGREVNPESLEKVASVIGYEVITPHISKTYSLDQARDALAAVEAGHAAGKVIIEP